MFLAIVLPWLAGVVHEYPDFLYYGVVEETIRRYMTLAFRRTEPAYYCAPVLVLAFHPWSTLPPDAAVAAWRARAGWTRADRLFLVWAAVVLVLFSTSQSKRPGYILTGAIALGVLTARVF